VNLSRRVSSKVNVVSNAVYAQLRDYGLELLCMLAMLAVPLAARAQFNSSIRGEVSDPSGANVPGASVSVTNLETSITQNTTTSDSGSFDFRSLAPSNYRLDVKAAGFETTTVRLTLQTDQTLNSPVQLAVASASAPVQVVTEGPLLDTADSRLQTTLPRTRSIPCHCRAGR
jgi:Carboxypeptidase regulatory-like domain